MKRLSFLVAFAVGFAISAAAGPIDVPVQWTGAGANNHWYQLVLAPVTWDQAVSGAEAMGGYLATITSADENLFVFGLASNPAAWSIDASGNNHGPRLGGADVTLDGDWRWVTGETWSYTNWYAGEPNFKGIEDSLALFDASRPVGVASTWNNVAKSSILPGYVVEWTTYPSLESETPEPTTLLLMSSAVGLLFWRRRRHA
jgi:hypothetical protein